MTDRRLTPANGRVAAAHLKGVVQAETYCEGTEAQIAIPITDLCASPGGARDRQLLLGAAVTVYEWRAGWAFVQAAHGYVGYVAETAIGPHSTPTHIVATAATHAYKTDSIKSPDLMGLSFGTRLSLVNERKQMMETNVGFVPKAHLRPLDKPFKDPVSIAQLFFGTPYLWGGNSRWGIDCSGLIQAALQGCGQSCPGDSDLQMNDLGMAISEEVELTRGDLLFWKGHVGIMVDQDIMIHANAHAMATTYEPIQAAIARIKAQDGGDIIARKRIS